MGSSYPAILGMRPDYFRACSDWRRWAYATPLPRRASFSERRANGNSGGLGNRLAGQGVRDLSASMSLSSFRSTSLNRCSTRSRAALLSNRTACS